MVTCRTTGQTPGQTLMVETTCLYQRSSSPTQLPLLYHGPLEAAGRAVRLEIDVAVRASRATKPIAGFIQSASLSMRDRPSHGSQPSPWGAHPTLPPTPNQSLVRVPVSRPSPNNPGVNILQTERKLGVNEPYIGSKQNVNKVFS